MKLKVKAYGTDHEFFVPTGVRLLDGLHENQIHVNSSCGGKGSCQKCRVQITAGFSALTPADRRAFTEAELAQGWRLSCQSLPRTNLDVFVPEVENPKSKPRVVKNRIQLDNPVIACDLGSTGVVVALSDLKHGPAIEVHSLNGQIRYGADVMTRLASAQKLGTEPLREAILKTLYSCCEALFEEIENSDYKNVFKALLGKANSSNEIEIFCSGNSAMVSLLFGWSIESLAVSPFQPARTEEDSCLMDVGHRKVLLKNLPLLGGFVGADTVAGIFYLESKNTPAPWMLVDIGTNTEIVIKTSKGHYLYSSAPAGPAFEGGNISQGMRAEPGAVGVAHWKEDTSKWDIQTIGGDRARGICGSGLMDIIFESVKFGLIDREGFVPHGKLTVTEGISILADDVREFQLAKSATRSACDLLMDRVGETPQQIFLAGAFAQNLRKDTIAGLGLLPQGIPFAQIGNSSLKGTILYAGLSHLERSNWMSRLKAQAQQIELALQDDFQEAFVKNLNF